ncbi:MAG TPA: class I SAM-dependent methyltransferase [Gemmatimonadaceae bacterium]|nr:class I SAM-dependent methyltransferase [Gemmatimonadaceae bacterium]
MHLTYRKTCRVCGSTALKPVISLGEQHLQGSFLKVGKEIPPMRKIDCSLMRCDPTQDENACGLLQMRKSVPPSVLYSAYWYRSGTNQTMRNHLSGIAATAVEMVGESKAAVLDIGANDGTLLRAYPKGFRKFGIDPSDIVTEIKDDDITVVNDLFPSPELDRVLGKTKLDVVTSIAMFYDLEDPVAFAQSIERYLAEDGLWIVEMSYMPKMLEMNSYDTICHEHLEYYSLAVLEQIMARAKLKVVRVEENDINGGSIRCYVAKKDSVKYINPEWRGQIALMRQQEFDLELDTDKPYQNFQDRINVHREKLLGMLKRLKAEGKSIHIYGASTKGNTILQWCGIDNRLIDYAADRNPDKFGAKTLGTDIPIISEADSRAMKPDFYLVLPWHFEAEFVKREAALLDAGVGMIFPLPEIRVVKR